MIPRSVARLKQTRIYTAVLITLGIGLGAAGGDAKAQSTDRVEITGSAIKRVDAEGAFPITVIRMDDLVKQGVTAAEQALARIAFIQSNFQASASMGGTTGGKCVGGRPDLSALTGSAGARPKSAMCSATRHASPTARESNGPGMLGLVHWT